jgi:hypothetical protein
MQANVGSADRVLRLIVGLFLIVAPLLNLFGIWSGAAFTYGSVIVGLVLAATAVFRFCPLYRLIGVSTCKV